MRSRSIGLILLVLAAFPSVSLAQQFSFGFSSGHHHHHGRHGCHGGWYGFDFYRPAPVYVYPPPPVYVPPPVTYVYPAPAVQVVQQPALSQAQPQSSPAQLAANSSLRTNSVPSQQRSNVVLHNPAENAGGVAFRVQDQVDAELAPGMTRTWNDRTSLTVEFDRGGSFGATRKILRPGAYEFIVTEEGWDLVATVNPPTTSRSASLQRNSLPPRR